MSSDADKQQAREVIIDAAKVAREDKIADRDMATVKERHAFYGLVLIAVLGAMPATLAAWRVGAQEQKLSAIHTLVNSNMAAQLKISAQALRSVAELTKKPEDLAAAALAEKLLEEHEIKQRLVDVRENR